MNHRTSYSGYGQLRSSSGVLAGGNTVVFNPHPAAIKTSIYAIIAYPDNQYNQQDQYQNNSIDRSAILFGCFSNSIGFRLTCGSLSSRRRYALIVFREGFKIARQCIPFFYFRAILIVDNILSKSAQSLSICILHV